MGGWCVRGGWESFASMNEVNVKNVSGDSSTRAKVAGPRCQGTLKKKGYLVCIARGLRRMKCKDEGRLRERMVNGGVRIMGKMEVEV